MKCGARLMVLRTEDEGGYGLSRARGFPFVRIELQECGLVWQRCVPTEVQRLTWLAAAEFASAQLDAYVNPEEVGNPEGGWEDEDYRAIIVSVALPLTKIDALSHVPELICMDAHAHISWVIGSVKFLQSNTG